MKTKAKTSAWCFTTDPDPKKNWEHCDIRDCSGCDQSKRQYYMYGRHKNFKDLMNKSWDMNKTKIQMYWVFFQRPLGLVKHYDRVSKGF